MDEGEPLKARLFLCSFSNSDKANTPDRGLVWAGIRIESRVPLQKRSIRILSVPVCASLAQLRLRASHFHRKPCSDVLPGNPVFDATAVAKAMREWGGTKPSAIEASGFGGKSNDEFVITR